MLKFDRRYVLLAMLLGIVSVATAFFVSESGRNARIAGVDAIQRSQVRNRLLAELQLALTDAESAQRGFMLTGDDEYLEPYRISKQQADSLLSDLSAAYARSTPSMESKREDLAKLIATKFADIDATLSVYQKSRSLGMALTKTNFGQRSMDSVRELTRDMREQEQEFVRAQTEDWLRDQNTNRTITAGGAILNVLLIVLAGVLVTRDLRRRTAAATELESQVAAATAELSELSTYLQRVSERERSSLARELHDELGGLLIAIKMDLAQLKGQIDLGKEDVRTRWERIQSTLSAGIDLKRRVIEQLRPSLLDNMGLVAALKWQASEVCSSAKLVLTESYPENEPSISSDTAIALFRIAQEALTNIIKHARASHVFVTLAMQGERLNLIIEDDGIGIAWKGPTAIGSQGIAGMKHRAKSFNGEFKFERRIPTGTRVIASVDMTHVATSPMNS
ncbi:MAG TPA: CHASE3 domain-containing protein [Steroidobacteraceae bacterium]|nr:CHASE3 domain-containing protein [Steroidobacteraceae bacterium]